MPIKLYVDDIRSAPPGWELCRTITKAIRILATTDVSEVSLDHDIIFKRDKYNKGESETFEPVCRYIAFFNEVYGDMPIKVYCHSGNPEAYSKYSAILDRPVQPLQIKES